MSTVDFVRRRVETAYEYRDFVPHSTDFRGRFRDETDSVRQMDFPESIFLESKLFLFTRKSISKTFPARNLLCSPSKKDLTARR